MLLRVKRGATFSERHPWLFDFSHQIAAGLAVALLVAVTTFFVVAGDGPDESDAASDAASENPVQEPGVVTSQGHFKVGQRT